MSWSIYDVSGKLAEQADDATSTVTIYNPDGTVASTRPYTAAETAAAQAEAAVAQSVAITDADQTVAQTLLASITADIGTRADVWPTTKSLRALVAVDPTTLTLVQTARAVVWLAGVALDLARGERKLTRLLLHITSPDTTT